MKVFLEEISLFLGVDSYSPCYEKLALYIFTLKGEGLFCKSVASSKGTSFSNLLPTCISESGT